MSQWAIDPNRVAVSRKCIRYPLTCDASHHIVDELDAVVSGL
jgi:hypothetical protein